ncbi:MAG: hypothetical protein KGQ83_01610 [Planctomycetes bacterium]|nr:hypothetical protein [Planctomycetota bacterium]
MRKREANAIKAGVIKSLDGIHAMMRRERVGKYGAIYGGVDQSPVSAVRNARKKAEARSEPVDTAPKWREAKRKTEYVFRFGETAIKSVI